MTNQLSTQPVKRRRIRVSLFDAVNTLLLLLVTFICLYPIYYAIIASFSDYNAVATGQVGLLPVGFQLTAYQAVFENRQVWQGYWNTIQYTVGGTAFNLFLTIPAAYAMSKKRMLGHGVLTWFFLITMYFGGGMIPTYLIVKQTHLIGSMWSLFLPGGVAVGNMIIVRNYFQNSIPRDLIEASSIDGCSKFRTFLSVVIPLSMPILAVQAVFAMVAYWNDWFTAMIYLGGKGQPLPLVLRGILIKSSASTEQAGMIEGGFAELNKLTEMIKFSSMIVAALPMLIAYPFVQKYFEKGFMAGAVKG